jgi:hypothetical protein
VPPEPKERRIATVSPHKKILVVSFSQSGQLTEIVSALIDPIVRGSAADAAGITMVTEALRPIEPFPFPWTALEFVDVFPESLEEIPCRLAPFSFDPDTDYDLIILAYQVWYLAPSIPITSFLQSSEAARVMRNRPVITLIGCRNMWLQAQEKVKRRIADNGGRLVGNIVLADRAPNLVGVITIAAWMLTGKKKRFFGILPQPGIAEDDIIATRRFAPAVRTALVQDRWSDLQPALNRLGATPVVPAFILFESRIKKIFAVWSAFIRRRGDLGDPARKPRLRIFIGYLLTAIFILAPVATGVTALIRLLKKEKINTLQTYFKTNHLKEP